MRTSLGDLLAQSEIPTLSKGNQSMQSTPHIEDTGHEEAAPVLKDIALPEGELFLPEGVEKLNRAPSSRTLGMLITLRIRMRPKFNFLSRLV